MEFMAKIKFVMFDFDGTLVDTAPDLVAATNRLLVQHGHQALAPEVIRKDIGTGLKTLIKDFFPEIQNDPLQEERLMENFLSLYKDEYLNSPQTFPGAEIFLKEQAPLLNLQTAIVSNKREELIHPILKRVGLDELPWVKVIGGNTFSTMKPDPQPLLEAINAAGVSPQETVLVGDGIPDIMGAAAVGCLSIAVSFGYAPIDQLMGLGAHARIDHYEELSALLSLL
jgi:phosphoglycolate phosphatase